MKRIRVGVRSFNCWVVHLQWLWGQVTHQQSEVNGLFSSLLNSRSSTFFCKSWISDSVIILDANQFTPIRAR